MKLGEFYASMKPDIRCAACGKEYETSYGQDGKWRIIGGTWRHWCANQWHHTEQIAERTAESD